MNIRTLRANEIDCRIGQIKEKGLSLLLYKDARCDMNILDETFGSMNWMRRHLRDNANCVVSIWDAEKQQWIDKEDTGTESNTEAEKGLASDSFKRACVNVGIGRELYTSPFIWISANDCTIENRRCYDKFVVQEIGYDGAKNIIRLVIKNATTGKVVFKYGFGNDSPKVEPMPEPIPAPKKDPTKYICSVCGNTITPYIKDGKTILSVREVAQKSEGKYGQPICLDCGKKLYPDAK